MAADKDPTAVCPICGSDRLHYAFSIRQTRVLQCADCKFTARTSPTASPAFTRGSSAAEKLARTPPDLNRALAQIVRPTELSAPIQIADWGWDGTLEVLTGFSAIDGTPDKTLPPITLSVGQLDAFTNPLPSLRKLRSQLLPGQPVVFVFSDIHQSARAGTPDWEKQAEERNAYVDTTTALTILYRAGFRCMGVRRLRERVSLEHWLSHSSDNTAYRRARLGLIGLLPRFLRMRIHVTARGVQTALLTVPRTGELPLVSIVVPVFNEKPTVAKVIDAVLAVQLVGAELEVVIVESNSTDGSREIVQGYAAHPRVTCIFEDRPQGKGHATRRGLDQARGDILLIQDADLEYDIEDYVSLLNPIIRGHEAFVLGSRHGGRQHWKLRQFTKPFLAAFYNLAHVLVTGYINLLFGLHLRDPQTMFKVCRRDCIEGIGFHANYFNFDYELLLKVVRKGYTPVEVPVNYRSRSHAEGKKIRMWRDAPLGLWMITKLRLTPLARFLHIGEPIE
ncbi:MAG: glycosyltransferase [Opitutus sp.]